MTKEQIISMLEERARFQDKIGEYDNIEINGISAYCMGYTGNCIHLLLEK